jgi:hypothetical protein
MNAKEQVLSLVNRFPGATNHSIENAAANEAVTKLVDELLAGGTSVISGLVDLLVDPASGTPEDAKARFLLHAAVVRAGSAGSEKERKQLAGALAATLVGDRPKEVLACVVRELQWIASTETASALGKFLADETLCEDAARAIVNIGGEAAAAEFRAALLKAEGKRRLTILQNLGVLRDAKSAAALKSAAADADPTVRVTAVWGLANIGEPSAVEVAIKAVSAEGWERVRHTKSCLLLAERLAASGKKNEARQIYNHLRTSRPDDSDAYIREAAERGLAAIDA